MQKRMSVALIFSLIFYLTSTHAYSQEASHKDDSLLTVLRAAICDNTTDGKVLKSTLLNCKRLIVIDSASHRVSGFEIESYEVVIVPKGSDPKVISVKGAKYSKPLRRALNFCSVGDLVVFRKIIARGENKDSVKLNGLVLRVD